MIQGSVAAADTVVRTWGALISPRNPNDFWEMANAIFSLTLLLAAFWGLKSLSLAKKDMRDRAQREAAARTIERCRELGDMLLPRHGRILSLLGAQGIPLFISNVSDVSFDKSEESKKIGEATNWTKRLDQTLQFEVITLMNEMEVWSMCFTHALADAKVAFDPCSPVYCQMVMTLYPALLHHRRTNPASGPYQNIVSLFEGWYNLKANDELLAQLKRVKDAKLPAPIGTSP